MKVNITLDDELMQRVDAYADENYMSRSGLLSVAVTQYLNQQDVIRAMKGLALSMAKIAETNKIDDDTKKELEDFERIARLLYNFTIDK